MDTQNLDLQETDHALRTLAVVKYLKSRLNKAEKTAKLILEDRMREGDRLTGYDPSGKNDIVTVTRPKPGRNRFAVVDETSFIKWLENHDPEIAEYHVVKSLSRQSMFRKHDYLEGFLEKLGGEIPDGVGEGKASSSSPRVTQTRDQEDNLIETIQQVGNVLALIEAPITGGKK